MDKSKVTVKGNRGVTPFSALPAASKQVIAIDHLLIWTYKDQAADSVAQQFMGRAPVLAIQRGILERAALGVAIDCSGSAGFANGRLHPDADAVNDVVLAMASADRGLIISYAKSEGAPDWMPGAISRPVPLRRPNGKPRVEYYDIDRRKPSHCPIVYTPHPERIVAAREVFSSWHRAIEAVRRALPGLQRFSAAPPSLPAAPWIKRF